MLPEVLPPSRAGLVAFDLRHGFPTALSVLSRHLGVLTTLRLFAHFGWRSLVQDPLRHVETKPQWTPLEEKLTRHQLRPVLLLDDVLTKDLKRSREETFTILHDVVRTTGARFIEANVPLVQLSSWSKAKPAERASFLEKLTKRLFNARIVDVTPGERSLAFDVKACRFVELLTELDRRHLAPMFCAADSAFFSRPGTPLFDRATTLAEGGHACTFRFRYADDDAATQKSFDPAA